MDKVKAGKALFYYGKVAALQGNDTLAMQAYLSALAKLEKTEEYKMMALVHQYVGRLNDDSESVMIWHLTTIENLFFIIKKSVIP